MKYYNSCLGCGVSLQTTNENKNGYILNENNKYCLSCFKLKNYGQYTQKIIDTNEINKIIDSVIENASNSRIYYLIDLFNLHTSINFEILEKLNKNNVETVFIINKVDLFRDISNLEKITDFFVEYIKNLGFKEPMFLIMNNSSKKLIAELILVIQECNKNQYFIGVSNSGKSTMINSMLKELYNNNQIVESYIPNTTEKIIPLSIENKEVFDTPGFSRDFSILKNIDPSFLREFNPEKRIKQFTFQLNDGHSIVLDTLFGISVESTVKVNIHIYVSKKTNLHRTKTVNLENYILKNIVNYDYLSKFERSEMSYKKYKIKANNDFVIYIADIGWIVAKSNEQFNLSLSSIYLNYINITSHYQDNDFIWYNHIKD
ncbi:30S ribosome assembly GTPase [Spiroplasma sp. TIUS-1]|uniref:GTPase n=1 Tax=Spiroplasma sp. TIUS-1 TaxID=216963 RepID=UPI001397B645|nr:GTPase [Spiroplasma sp. TIUS-1]QHX35912.1 30S ribosome assembly GTPase [Spiroplasma sp. TIUS-1]